MMRDELKRRVENLEEALDCLNSNYSNLTKNEKKRIARIIYRLKVWNFCLYNE